MDFNNYIDKALNILSKGHISITKKERELIEIADFGLSDYPRVGLQILTYYNSPEYCSKELIMLPNQVCPEHRHPPYGEHPGKKETFRCRWGKVYLFVDDLSLPRLEKDMINSRVPLPAKDRQLYSCDRYIELTPGDQYTIPSNTLHWFVSGPDGAIVSEFSTENTDVYDVFTDIRVKRISS